MSTHALKNQRSVWPYAAFWQDGLLDMFAGVGVMLVGMGWVADHVAMSSLVPAVLAAGWPSIRSRVMASRTTPVQRTERQDRRVAWCLLTLGAATFTAFALYCVLVSHDAAWMRAAVPALPAALVGLLAAASGVLMGLPRFGAYAIALVAFGAGVAWLGVDPGPSLILGGAVVTVSGAILLRRFVRRFPRQTAPAP